MRSCCSMLWSEQQSDRAALLIRQYVKDSLYDRISTRPFLSPVEKKWIAYQLLCAVNQCHKLNVSVRQHQFSFILICFAKYRPKYNYFWAKLLVILVINVIVFIINVPLRTLLLQNVAGIHRNDAPSMCQLEVLMMYRFKSYKYIKIYSTNNFVKHKTMTVKAGFYGGY